jgi:hypothetical protein
MAPTYSYDDAKRPAAITVTVGPNNIGEVVILGVAKKADPAESRMVKMRQYG